MATPRRRQPPSIREEFRGTDRLPQAPRRARPGTAARPFPVRPGRADPGAEICAPCWRDWLQHQTLLINHFGLDPRKAASREFLYAQTRAVLFGRGRRDGDRYVEAGHDRPALLSAADPHTPARPAGPPSAQYGGDLHERVFQIRAGPRSGAARIARPGGASPWRGCRACCSASQNGRAVPRGLLDHHADHEPLAPHLLHVRRVDRAEVAP